MSSAWVVVSLLLPSFTVDGTPNADEPTVGTTVGTTELLFVTC